MKKIFTFPLALLVFFACSKEVDTTLSDPDAVQTIIAEVGSADITPEDDETKLQYWTSGNNIGSNWQSGDYFYAIQDGTTTVRFDIISSSISSDKQTAKFQATTSGVTSQTKWVAVTGKGMAVKSNELHLGYADQDGTTSNLDKYNYSLATGTGTNPTFNFRNGGLSYIMWLKLPAGVKCIEYTPCAWHKVTGDGAATIYHKSNDGDVNNINPTYTVTLSSASAKWKSIYIAVPAINHSETADKFNNNKQMGNLKTGVIITLLNDTSDNATASNGTILAQDLSAKGGKVGVWDISGVTLIKRPKPSDAIEFKTGALTVSWNSGTLKQKASTGLDTYWAPYNVGAESETQTGTYYAWGEAKVKDNFTFVSHSLRHNNNGTQSYDYISSQVTSGSDISYYTISGSRYDVARVKWGSAWRMAHAIEYKALFDNTVGHGSSLTRETISSVEGYKIAGAEGSKYLFFPICGFKNADVDPKNNDPKSNGKTYNSILSWTGDLPVRAYGTTGYDRAYFFHGFSSENRADADIDETIQRKSGVPVRAVLSKSTIK